MLVGDRAVCPLFFGLESSQIIYYTFPTLTRVLYEYAVARIISFFTTFDMSTMSPPAGVFNRDCAAMGRKKSSFISRVIGLPFFFYYFL